MAYTYSVLSIFILLSAFLLIANKKTQSYITTFRHQSILIALTAGIMAVNNLFHKGEYDLFLICILILILKVYYIPNMLNKTYANVEYKVEKDFFYNIPVLVIISCCLVFFIHFTISNIEGINQGAINLQLVNSISVVLIGLLFMISRKKALGQVVGFLVIENGLFISAMFATDGMPFIVDMGIFIDLITAVLVMAVMVFKINEEFESINTKKLKNLRG